MRDTPKILAAILLTAALPTANAADRFVDPGSMEAQHCTGTVSGGYSGVITACGLTVEMLGGIATYTFKFRVAYGNGFRTEGVLLGHSATLGKPVTGRVTHTAFEMGTTASVDIPTGNHGEACMMLYGETSELNFGSYALDISRVPAPAPESLGDFEIHPWLNGSIRMQLPPVPGHPADPCPGITVEASFRARR